MWTPGDGRMSYHSINARNIFMAVYETQVRELRPGDPNWTNEDADEIKELGISLHEARAAFLFLERKGLLKRSGGGKGSNFGLTDLGFQACFDASIREKALDGPDENDRASVHIENANAPFQLGNNNVQNISTVLQQVSTAIDAD